MKHKFYFFIFFIFWAKAYSQSPVIPPSPTASGLGKYADIPVSYYNGLPSINIPLYEINLSRFKLPISLDYYASGIRIEDEASWTGLGWNLLAGGAITKSTRGKSDLAASSGVIGYPYDNNPITPDEYNYYFYPYLPQQQSADVSYFNAVVSGISDHDPEPDLFYFNFCGHSGQFVFEKSNVGSPLKVCLKSQEKLDIKVTYDGVAKGWRWIITDTEGTKFYFGTPEYSHTSSGRNSTEAGGDMSANFGLRYLDINAWYLDKVQTANGEEINFKYKENGPGLSNGTKRTLIKSEEKQIPTVIYGGGSGASGSHSYISTLVVDYNVYLDEITFKNGKIAFLTSDREDMETGVLNPAYDHIKAQKLEKIIISSNENNVISVLKSYELSYSYYDKLPDPHTNSESPFLNTRLRLENVLEKDALGNANSPYIFGYSGDRLPPKNSKARDHWGFYNGKNNENIYYYNQTISTLLTGFSTSLGYFNDERYYPGANREPDTGLVKIGVLNKIIYPTGGETLFEFESNDYHNFVPETTTSSEQCIAVLKGGPNTIGYEEEDNKFSFSLSSKRSVKIQIYNYSEEFDCFTCASQPPQSIMGCVIRSIGSTPSYYKNYLVPLKFQGGLETRYEIIPAGTYEVEVFSSGYYIMKATLCWEEDAQSTDPTSSALRSKPGGGIRIKNIKHFDNPASLNSVEQNFVYTDTIDGMEKSSGLLMTTPVYSYYTPVPYVITNPDDNGSNTLYHMMLVCTSNSTIPLGNSAQGGLVGYGKVSVFGNNSGANGKSEFRFVNAPDLPSPPPVFPDVPNTVNLSNGLLTSSIDYLKDQNGRFRKLKEVTRDYSNEIELQKKVKGMKCFGYQESIEINYGVSLEQKIRFYDFVSEWWHPSWESVKLYDPNDENKFTEQQTSYYYDNPSHFQSTRIETVNSDGSKEVTYTSYPEDYASGTAFIDDMKTKHLISYPIEQVKYKVVGTARTILSGTVTKYLAGGKGLVDQVMRLETSLPIALSSFKFSNRLDGQLPPTGAATTFAPHILYSPVLTYNSYDSYGNPLQATLEKGQISSYLWSYNGQYPVAEAKNAQQSDIAYTGFEADGKGNWAYSGATVTDITAPAGRKIYSLSGGGLSKAGLSTAKRYVLTYWAKSATATGISGGTATVIGSRTGWTQYQRTVTGVSAVSLSGSVYLDEVRLCPEDAQMSTYTYDPFKGMTSSTDASGRTTYYGYDSFGRLQTVKDTDGEQTGSYDYHYSNQ